MKSCKNKFILLLVSLLTCATVFTFVGCADGETADDINNNGQSTGDITGDTLLSCPILLMLKVFPSTLL